MAAARTFDSVSDRQRTTRSLGIASEQVLTVGYFIDRGFPWGYTVLTGHLAENKNCRFQYQYNSKLRSTRLNRFRYFYYGDRNKIFEHIYTFKNWKTGVQGQENYVTVANTENCSCS